MPNNALRAFVDRLGTRVRLSPLEEELLLELPGETVSADANRDVVRLGQAVQYAYLVVDGIVARFGQTLQGHRQAVILHLPGEVANLTSVILPAARQPLQALTPVSTLKIPHSAIRVVADISPNIARAFWLECAVEASMLAEHILTIGRGTALLRMSHLTAELACRFRAGETRDGMTFPFPLTQTHLADALGLTAVHVNRTLRELRERGILTIARRQAEVHDWRALVTLGEFDPAYLHLSARSGAAEIELVPSPAMKRRVAPLQQGATASKTQPATLSPSLP